MINNAMLAIKLSVQKFLFFAVLVIMVTGTAFGQLSDLALDSSDIRFEPIFSNDTVIGYSLFVRKKPGMESVMLTEPTGYFALRSIEWNPVNGYERRELSGVPLSDAYSRYSILSSTSIRDIMFGIAFHLFIPLRVVYGNPSSPAGTTFLCTGNGVQINIRTFDHRYADPNTGRFQNNLIMINTQNIYPTRKVPPSPVFMIPPSSGVRPPRDPTPYSPPPSPDPPSFGARPHRDPTLPNPPPPVFPEE